MLCALPGECAAQIREKFFHDTESDIARHRDAEADSTISGRARARRLPGARQKSSCRHSPESGDRQVATAVILPRKNAAGECVPSAWPKTACPRIEIAVVFV